MQVETRQHKRGEADALGGNPLAGTGYRNRPKSIGGADTPGQENWASVRAQFIRHCERSVATQLANADGAVNPRAILGGLFLWAGNGINYADCVGSYDRAVPISFALGFSFLTTSAASDIGQGNQDNKYHQ